MLWRNKLAAGLFGILAIAATAKATSASMPEAMEIYSSDKLYKFEITPPKEMTIRDAMDKHNSNYFGLTVRNPERAPSDFLVCGRLSVRLKGSYVPVWQRVLENAVSPGRAIVVITKAGVRVITLNDFFLFRDSAACVVIYDDNGRTLRKLSLCEIATKQELDQAYARSDVADLLQKVELDADYLEIRMPRSIIRINLINGKNEPAGQLETHRPTNGRR
jgi:hypothetical protein